MYVILTDQQLPKRLLEQMKINLEGILKEQSRQENKQQHMSVDISPLIDRFCQLIGEIPPLRDSYTHQCTAARGKTVINEMSAKQQHLNATQSIESSLSDVHYEHHCRIGEEVAVPCEYKEGYDA